MDTLPLKYALQYHTPAEWAQVALQDFDRFLLDHAACERKAAAVGMSFVVRYPDRGPALLEPMIQFAREEMEHFHQVYRWIAARGLHLREDEQDDYVQRLMAAVRHGRDARFLDRLLCASLIEARGTERLGLMAHALPDGKLKTFYERLTRAEGHHHTLFLRLALLFFPQESVAARLAELLPVEAEAIACQPFRGAVH